MASAMETKPRELNCRSRDNRTMRTQWPQPLKTYRRREDNDDEAGDDEAEDGDEQPK